jgi:hypothetical protein
MFCKKTFVIAGILIVVVVITIEAAVATALVNDAHHHVDRCWFR